MKVEKSAQDVRLYISDSSEITQAKELCNLITNNLSTTKIIFVFDNLTILTTPIIQILLATEKYCVKNNISFEIEDRTGGFKQYAECFGIEDLYLKWS